MVPTYQPTSGFQHCIFLLCRQVKNFTEFIPFSRIIIKILSLFWFLVVFFLRNYVRTYVEESVRFFRLISAFRRGT